MVNPLYIRTGKAVITNNELLFFDDLKSMSCKDDYDDTTIWKKNIEFIKYKKRDHCLLMKSWNLSEIIMIHYRSFLSKNSSAEVYFYKEKSILLFFDDSDQRDSFCKHLYKSRNKKEFSIKVTSKADDWNLYDLNSQFLVKHGRRSLKDLKITERWVNWEISNYEYLMYLNIYANRTFNDLSHYPVFPWLHLNQDKQNAEIKSIEGCMRDLAKNMGQLGSNERLEEFIRKYEEGDCFENDSYHYGSHYSHPGIILHYLIRLHPFTEGCLSLQGGQYDVADRLFYSVPHAIESALNDISDVREIIPEFFFMPEMFQQTNDIKFGRMQSGQEVNNVILPKWCNNDPYKYVYSMKRQLESEEVSYTINQWIDLIYGYKQYGEEAVKAINVYPLYTYDSSTGEREDDSKQMHEEVKISQAYNFGQTPSLMFKEAHRLRKSKQKALKYNLIVDLGATIRPYRPVDNQRSVVIFYSKFIDHK